MNRNEDKLSKKLKRMDKEDVFLQKINMDQKVTKLRDERACREAERHEKKKR